MVEAWAGALLLQRSLNVLVALLLPHSLNVLARSLLELATSFLGVERLRQEEKLLAFRKLFAGSHSLILQTS